MWPKYACLNPVFWGEKRRKQFELMVALMVLDGIKWLVFRPAVKAKIMGHPQSLYCPWIVQAIKRGCWIWLSWFFFSTVVHCLVLTQFPQSVAVQNTALDWLLPTKNEITPNIDFIPIQFSHAPWDVFWVYSCPDSFIPTLGQPLECFQILVQFSYLLIIVGIHNDKKTHIQE